MGHLRIWPRLTSQTLQDYGPDGRLAALAKWEKRPSLQKNASGNVAKGRGISYVKYELGRTYIGAVAEVEVAAAPASSACRSLPSCMIAARSSIPTA